MDKDFAALIRTWPRDGKLTPIASFAKAMRLPYQHAVTMALRNSISPEHWPRLLKVAPVAGKPVTYDDLLRLRRWHKKRQRPKTRTPRQPEPQESAPR
jgi:hypothetical protein